MPSQRESDKAMSIADKSLQAALARIKHFAADCRVVVDQAHEIARIVSQALQLHGRNASVISPLLLSAGTEVRVTMNVGQAPQWDCVLVDDSHMESHPFFRKTLGFEALAPAPLPNPVSPVPPAPKVMSVPPIDSLSLAVDAPTPKTDKGKQLARGTRQSREDDLDDESRKKRKVVKRLSKAIIFDTKDEDDQPGGTIVVAKPSKATVLLPAAPPKSKGNTKEVKQATTEARIGRPMPKGKGKEKAVEITEPEQYNPPYKRCVGGDTCLVVVGRKGQVIKSCSKCYHMKVRCDRPTSVDDNSPAPTEQVRESRPWSKAPPATKSRAQSRATQATSRVHQPTPAMDSKDAMEDTDDAVAAHEDIDMSHEADNEQHTDIAVVAPKEPEVEQPAAIASAEDITAQNLQEDAIPIPPPSPALPIPPPPPATEPTTHECLIALTAQVAAMEMADRNALTRVDAMELDFDSRICSMSAELSAMQFDVSATVTLVNGLLNMVEKLQQERSVPNPSFLPPTMGPSHGSSATAMGMRYLNGVFGPSVTPNIDSVDVGQPSVSRPFGRPDAQGSTFTSGQESSGSAQAGPSSAPAFPSHFTTASPASETNSLP
ncbi:hypothetical protein EV702DRAFT_1202577 [Suillus placidus]|uniref:Uncharacterized protein n=1 Tax=Suillus placidus TaxID=48579 RepID=A0A9P6ZLC9_9AGAM|nr:hypothetical protein EV702DRAFT_1202577 [Suillus placidus]